MTTILETKKKENKQEMQNAWIEFVETNQKSPEEAHRIIIFTMHKQQKVIDRLLQDNKTLWKQLQKYKTTQELISEGQPQSSTYRIVKKIWDNKEDEFWDTF